MTEVADFADIRGRCPDDPLQFSTTFDRLAQSTGAIGTKNGTRAGWYTRDGSFVEVGPASTTPDFGGTRTFPQAYGFDKHDNFYYYVEHIDDGGAKTVYEYFRVPPGSTDAGQPIGSADGNRSLGLLPDGTLALDVEAPCVPPIFKVSQGVVVERFESCENGAPGRALIPRSTYKIDSLVASPDRTQVAFKVATNKLYVVDAAGGDPRQIQVKQRLRDSSHYEMWGWT